MNDVSEVILDDGPGDLVIRLRGVLYTLPGHVKEGHNVLQHAHSLVEWAVAVVGCVGILLEEVILDQFGHF